MTDKMEYMLKAIELSAENLRCQDGGPFGCIIVKENQIVGKGKNMVLINNDPTAHAEVVAIRDACKNLNTPLLAGCELYTSCEPCPMCLGAIYWARPEIIYYANTRDDAANIGFDDAFIYDEINLPFNSRKIKMVSIGRKQALEVFEKWYKETARSWY